jgi:hypothetical protein
VEGPRLTWLEALETAVIRERHDEDCVCWHPVLRSVYIFHDLTVGVVGPVVLLKSPILQVWAGLN